jgi:hypothetical protein
VSELVQADERKDRHGEVDIRHIATLRCEAVEDRSICGILCAFVMLLAE